MMEPTPGKPTQRSSSPPAKGTANPASTMPETPAADAPQAQDATQLFTDTVPTPQANQKSTSPETKIGTAKQQRAAGLAATELLTGTPSAVRAKPKASDATPDQARPAAKPAEEKSPRGDGQAFGDFRLDKKLGEGGMGAVFKAHQLSLDRTVALKLLAKNLNGNQTFVDRFVREARTMAKLDHPNIVRGYAVGQDPETGQHFVAMEFIEGDSMQKWMNKLGKLSVGDAVHVALSTAYALDHAHSQNLIHRDIKPDNILMTSKGVVKLADLGLAKQTDDNMSLTQSGTGFGTPYYMPLEQYRDAKHVDGRADTYALGVTLYYFLTGKFPFFGGTHFDVIKAKESAKFTPAKRLNPEIPERLDLMIDKMIQKDAAHRYQTCAEVIEALESLDVASPFPSFVGAPPQASGSGKTGPASATRPSTLPPKTKIAPPPGQAAAEDAARDMWVLRYKDESGKTLKKQVSTGRLKQLLQNGEIDASKATVHRTHEQNQRPIGSVPEFSSLVQSKMVQAKADRRSQKLDNAYAKIERAERRRHIFRAIDGFFRGLTGWIVILAVLAGLAFGGWWLFKNKDTVVQKAQEAVKSVQDSSTPSSKPDQPIQ